MEYTISAVILAGGKARRMNGADKGLQLLKNKPLISHVIERLQPQVIDISINANRHHEEYAQWGFPVFQMNCLISGTVEWYANITRTS